jgi:hypothetical protein
LSDPEVGRFTTADSFLGNIDQPPSLHRFVYGWNRPTFFIDPTGHEVKAVGVDTTRITWDEFGRPYVGAVTAVETETVEVRAYPDRASAVAAELDVNLAQPMNRLATRGMGGVRVVGGGVQVAVGAAGLAAPEPTMVTKVAGGVAIAHGIDDIQAGLRQATTGVVVETLTGTAIRKGAEKAGASPETAALISAGGEFVIAAGSTGLAARGIPAPQRTTLGRITPEQAAPEVSAAGGRTYITYELKNAQGEVVYVGRASGVGTPEQVMQGRLARGHDVFDANPGLRTEIKAVQGGPAANKGAEGVLHEQRLREGARLLNDPKSPPLSSKPSKAAEVRAKIDAYHEDLKQP